MKNKKAEMSINVLIIICITLITGTLLLFFVARLSSNTSNMTNLQACRNSIILAAKTREIQGKPLTNLDCKRSELVFRKKEVVENGEVNQEKVGQILLEAMAECWYMFGEGKLDPFSSIGTAGTTYCLACKEIVFDDALKSYLTDKRESSDYDWAKHELLKAPDYESRMPNSEKTYNDYFNHYPKIGISESTIIDKEAVILKDGSLLGISALKIKSTQDCSFTSDSVKQVGYLVKKSGQEEDTMIASLFIAPPLHLRSYDWSGGITLKDRKSFLESAWDIYSEVSYYSSGLGLYIDYSEELAQCVLGIFDELPEPLPLCQIIIN